MTTAATPATAGLDARSLAALVSNVTETMCGFRFEPVMALETDRSVGWRVARLPITGKRPLVVALCCDDAGSSALGAALFSCAPDSLDGSMLDDSLCELLNMTAGQIKSALALDQALGLPRMVRGTDLPTKLSTALREGTILRARGEVNLVLWITEGDEPE